MKRKVLEKIKLYVWLSLETAELIVLVVCDKDFEYPFLTYVCLGEL